VTTARVRCEPHPDWPVAVVEGEVDLANVDEVSSSIEGSVANGALGLVLDLSDVTYLDSAGLRVLYRLNRHLQDRQQELRVVVPPNAVTYSLLVIAGFVGTVAVFPTRAAAAAAPPAGW
jgi:anti-anti-sigma factor